MDQDEILRLFGLYGDDVYRLALSMLGSRQDAEDVCQSVFLKLCEGRMRRREGREKSWLLTCAANQCRNLLRSPARFGQELSEEIPARPGGDGGESLEAVWRLPEKYRAVVHLYCFEGLDQVETAKILKITRTAVQTRLQRARAMLRKELDYEF